MNVDLRQYVLVHVPKTTCNVCQRSVYMLFPRGLDWDIMPPIFYLCLCGRIVQAGNPQEIAPSERVPA